MSNILNYTRQLIKEIDSETIKDFNSSRKSLLDAWKEHFKYLGTFKGDDLSIGNGVLKK
ncbi:MAG: hypothetical protein H8D97_01000 [Proteobacteria bacterium]|nr:hypothetical protein [Pseudomonadota bacterium]